MLEHLQTVSEQGPNTKRIIKQRKSNKAYYADPDPSCTRIKIILSFKASFWSQPKFKIILEFSESERSGSAKLLFRWDEGNFTLSASTVQSSN